MGTSIVKTSQASERIYLRHPKPDDFDEFFELYNSSKRHLKGFASSNFNTSVFEAMLVDAAKESNEYFVICKREDPVIVGTINLSQIFRKAFQNAYLGYLLGAKYRGNGYMTDAVSLILGIAFRRLQLHRVEANVQPINLPSIAVLIRNGFTKEGFSRKYLKIGGRWRDHERWAIVKVDWEK